MFQTFTKASGLLNTIEIFLDRPRYLQARRTACARFRDGASACAELRLFVVGSARVRREMCRSMFRFFRASLERQSRLFLIGLSPRSRQYFTTTVFSFQFGPNYSQRLWRMHYWALLTGQARKIKKFDLNCRCDRCPFSNPANCFPRVLPLNCNSELSYKARRGEKRGKRGKEDISSTSVLWSSGVCLSLFRPRGVE